MDTLTIALVETMPECHRASHRAAGNFGTYPHNGAQREWMPQSAVEIDDADEYDHIVRTLDLVLGMRVVAECGVDEDSDEGRIAELSEDGSMLVAWDSGVSTPVCLDEIGRVKGGVLHLAR